MPSRRTAIRTSDSFARRLETVLNTFGITQLALATKLGVSPGTVSGWLNRGYVPQPRILFDLAQALGVRPEWLLEGKEPKLNDRSQQTGEQVVSMLPSVHVKSLTKESSPAYPKLQVREIPLISWAQAGIATAFEEIPEAWQERIPAAVSDRHAFAIQLRGDSMEPRHSEGDVAIVLPHTAPRNGDLVIANIKDEGFAFKIMTLVGGNPESIRLTSYNQAYPPMEFNREQFHWIYPVHSVTKLIRR